MVEDLEEAVPVMEGATVPQEGVVSAKVQVEEGGLYRDILVE